MENPATCDQRGEPPGQVGIVDEARMPAATDAAIRALLCECFPADVEVFRRTRHWHGCAPLFSVVLAEGDRVVGHVGVIVRTIRWGGARLVVAGIQNVAVHPSLRGHGCGAVLMTRAMAEAADRGLQLGLLFCLPRLEKFYRELGWETVREPITMADADGNVVAADRKSLCLVWKLAGSIPPPGPIDLQGRDW